MSAILIAVSYRSDKPAVSELIGMLAALAFEVGGLGGMIWATFGL